MLVRCVRNRPRDLDPMWGEDIRAWFDFDDRELEIKVGNYYTVYCISMQSGWLQYFVADEVYASLRYPVGYFAPFFEVVDPRSSRYWIVCTQAESRSSLLLSFEEWARDERFYERLVDGEAPVQSVFRERKEAMDLEFGHPLVMEFAAVADAGWLLCPICGDAWRNRSLGELVRCTVCHAVSRNPVAASVA